MDRNFSFGNREFQLSKLDAFKQFHIVRRIAPIMSELMPAMKSIGVLPTKPEDVAKLTDDKKLEAVAKFAAPVMNGLSKLSDQDSEFVLLNLLSSVAMKQTAGNWASVATPTMLMMQDLELPQLMQLAGRAFMYNLSGFIAASPQSS
jgi:hypothetical protein